MYHSQVAITRNERKLFDIFYEIALLKGSTSTICDIVKRL